MRSLNQFFTYWNYNYHCYTITNRIYIIKNTIDHLKTVPKQKLNQKDKKKFDEETEDVQFIIMKIEDDKKARGMSDL